MVDHSTKRQNHIYLENILSNQNKHVKNLSDFQNKHMKSPQTLTERILNDLTRLDKYLLTTQPRHVYLKHLSGCNKTAAGPVKVTAETKTDECRQITDRI